MAKRLFLLDGMALVYRAHFAFVARPILTSKGVNTSALYGFTQTLLDILSRQQPTHLAVAFDTPAPTPRHIAYPEYKATRQEMPEDLAAALPHVRRMVEAFNIPILLQDGFEADDLIGTLARRAEQAGFQTFMVTPDKDFGQLVDANTFLFKPGKGGDEAELLGVEEIKARWGIQRPEQVVEVLALMGDASDNVPGVPGIGEKTAIKLIAEYGSVENLLANTAKLKGKLKESLETNRELALLSKQLVTIILDAPCPSDLETLKLRPPDEDKVKALLAEFEFNSIGRRLFGNDFQAGRGYQSGRAELPVSQRGATGEMDSQGTSALTSALTPGRGGTGLPRSGETEGIGSTPTLEPVLPLPEGEGRGEGKALVGNPGAQGNDAPYPGGKETEQTFNIQHSTPNTEGMAIVRSSDVGSPASSERRAGAETGAPLKTLADVPHEYRVVSTKEQRKILIETLQQLPAFAFQVEAVGEDSKDARLAGLAFSFQPHAGDYVSLPDDPAKAAVILEEFRPILESELIAKVGHDLKFALSVLKWRGLSVGGKLFDALIAHSLIEPEMRHGLDYLAEVFLGYSLAKGAGQAKEEQLSLGDVAEEKTAERATEAADIAWQLRGALEPLLKERGQERVFYEIEAPLVPVLVDMEREGIRVEAGALAEFAAQLAKEMVALEQTIHRLAGREFNVNSPRQLGEVLFDELKVAAAPKKTRTGQYSTDEQTLLALASDHEIIQRLLEYRAAAKLKSTYADVLPAAIWPKTGRVHTTYNQVMTATGRLSSINPNLQNIPIRTERGQEIRKAFVPRGEGYALLSADYSQIELRIIAGLSREPGLLEAFRTGADVHTATAAKVFGVALDAVTPEMRRKAKMVNYGIAYGISAFGLAQRLGIPRREGAEIIDQYFKEFAGIRKFMDDTIAFAREHGYVETVTGRRRYLRDIRSGNNTIRAAAERNAINAPIQGTAADMIKLAMVAIHAELTRRKLKTRLLLQVHDELVFDLWQPEEKEVRSLVEDQMKTAIPLDVPMVVEIGAGRTWIEAH